MDGNTRNTLKKKERLSGKTDISRLLAEGRFGSVPGIRYKFLEKDDSDLNRILISVPKKSFKRAVRRNLLKRRIRESWRRQKHILNRTDGVDILFMYSTKEVLSYEEISHSIGRIIENLNNERPAD